MRAAPAVALGTRAMHQGRLEDESPHVGRLAALAGRGRARKGPGKLRSCNSRACAESTGADRRRSGSTGNRCATRRRCPVASRPTPGSCRLMDTKITRTAAWVALLIYASGTGSALCDLCPAPLLDGTLTIPDTATLQLKASTQGGDATLTGPLGTISGRASVTCESGEFRGHTL